jgi:hypothetical protein
MENVINARMIRNSDKLKHAVGTKIYYRGDMANQPGFGEVAGHRLSKWGNGYNIKMDDGRVFNIEEISLNDVDKGHGGTRFVTLAAHNAYRNNLINGRG